MTRSTPSPVLPAAGSVRTTQRFGAEVQATPWLLAGLCALAGLAGCKPERPNIQEARQAEAALTASKVQTTLTDETTARKRAAGGIRPESLSPEQAATVVATVGSAKITLAEVAREIAKEPPHMQARYSSLENRQRLVEQMVQFELLVQEALELKLDQDPKVRAAYKGALARALMGTVPAPAPSAISEADIEAYYTANPSEFVTPELRRGAILVTSNLLLANKFRDEIAAAIVESPLKARQIFGDWVAKRTLDDKTRSRKGDLGFVDRNGKSEEQRPSPPAGGTDGLFGLEQVSAISAPLKLEDGTYALIQWTGHKPAIQQDRETARMEIRGKLLKKMHVKARQAFIATLMAKATIEMKDGALKSFKPAATGPTGKSEKAATTGTNTTGRRILKPNDTSALRRHLKKSSLKGGLGRTPGTNARPSKLATPGGRTNPKVDHKVVQEAIQKRKKKAEQNREQITLPP